ncbi:hypothetical protein Ae406Ps2_6460 [Pseudonocardia sp. Ae406_Ps2]|nr:hypothetical protein Ae406Ps2_6460 [Pseudonocardia sp. Ae406_Ps2]
MTAARATGSAGGLNPAGSFFGSMFPGGAGSPAPPSSGQA